MTESSGYMDPGSYDAAVFAAAQARMIKNGYQHGFLNALATTQNTPVAMNVLVDTGGCWIAGSWYLNDAVSTLTIDAADATLDRIDLIVARRAGTTSILLTVLKGTAAASPSAPAISTSLTGNYDLPLAQISIVHGTTAITTAMITDKRLLATSGPANCEMGFFTIDPATGNMAAGSKRITTLADPTNDQDADTKAARNAALALLDTLPSKTAHALHMLRVNSGATAYELVAIPTQFVTATAGATSRYADATERSATSIVPGTLVYSIYIPQNYNKGGTYTFTCDLHGIAGQNQGVMSVYVDDRALSSLTGGSGDGSVYETKTANVVIPYGGGSRIDIYVSGASASYAGYMRNFVLSCDESVTAPAW